MVALLFIVVPALEIYVLIQIGAVIGSVPTLAVIVATGIVGAVLARRQGLAAARAVQQSMARGEPVVGMLVEAALVLVAAVLLLTPGVMTDVAGLLLLLPRLRPPVARWIVRWGAVHIAARVVVAGPPLGVRAARADARDDDPPPPGVIDV